MESHPADPVTDRFGDAPGDPQADPAASFTQALRGLGELKNYVNYYIAAKADAIKLTVVKLVMYAVLGVIGAAVGLTILVTSVVLLCMALADGLGQLFVYLTDSPRWYWLGPFVFGLLVLALVAVGAIVGLKLFTKTNRKGLRDKYENRQRQQRRHYGHDVEDRAREERLHGRAEARHA